MKNPEKTGFLPKIGDFYLQKPSFWSFPRIYGSEKTSKNADEVSGFLVIFFAKNVIFPVYGDPPGPPNPKNHGFRPAGHPPPKIIKNRLNFAHSKICEKSDFN